MRPIILFLFFICCPELIYSQNYQFVSSSTIHYFKKVSTSTDFQPIQATSFDSIAYSSPDSIFYPFKTLGLNVDFVPSECSHESVPSWLGDKIILNPSGETLIINMAGDTILLWTSATLGDSFKCYTYASGDSIMATVTAVTQESYYGIQDSVKTFNLSSTEPSFQLDSTPIKVAQNLGLIASCFFNDFPNTTDYYELCGQDNPRLGITKPTFNDIHNLEVWDQIQYSYTAYPSSDKIRKRVLNKTALPGDSVSYTMNVFTEHEQQATGPNNPGSNYTSDMNVTEVYSISQNYYSDAIPEKLYVDNQNISAVYHFYHSDDCGYKIELVKEAALGTNGCFSNWHIPYKSYTSESGANNYYNYCNDPQLGGCSYSNNLVYKENSSATFCGTPIILNLNETNKVDISIFPNPTQNFISVQGLSNTCPYQIIDLMGKVVKSGHVLVEIDLSDLSQGAYILEIKRIGNEISLPLIKN